MLPTNHQLAGLRCLVSPAYRRQMCREMEAQFKSFDALGVGWSHVDSHVHFSLVPPVFESMLELCNRYGVSGLRVPEDDWELYRRLYPDEARAHRLEALWFSLLCARQRRRLRGTRLVTTRRCYGFFRSGRLDLPYLTRLIEQLPEGDHELHCHPDSSTEAGRTEMKALLSPELREALERRGVELATGSLSGE
jgi:chitin disaccharide deacetylase